jgi:tRNA 5-methylaminomethyl-2-thiouridine biosynthesis bifunctional protein
VASFSVAGALRRSLEAAGFVAEKKPGFGAKRERLEARLPGESARGRPAQRVAILGAGIAGAATAAALARRGVETVVLDASPQLGVGASGNPAGIVMPRLDRAGPLRELFLAAYLNAVAAYDGLGEDIFVRCGVEQRAEARSAEAMADLLADPPLPANWFSALPSGSAWHARAGVLKPLPAIHRFLRDAQVMLDAPVAGLEQAGDAWVLRGPDGRALLKADAVVLACGAALTRFALARFLPIELSRGQIEWGSGLARHAVAQSSYAAPLDGGVLFGSTFDAVEAEDSVQADVASRARNLAGLSTLSPEIAATINPNALQSRAAVRAATKDRAPIAGVMPDAEAWRTADFEARLPGLYVLGGLGARGLTLAPLLGEAIASLIFDEPQILSRPALDTVDPARFLRRAVKRIS